MPCVKDLLSEKGSNVHTATPGTSVLDAARRMNEHRVGALVVVDAADPARVVGMFTERDVLTRVVALNKAPGMTPVGDVMTERVLTCSPRTDVEEVRAVMREKRIRHLPVVEDDRLVGMVSLGDLNQAHVKVLVETVAYLQQYSVQM